MVNLLQNKYIMNMKKSALSILSCCISLLLLNACTEKVETGISAKTDVQPTVGQTLKNNFPVYTVAVDPAYPPYSFWTDKGSMQGLDIEILNKIAKLEGFLINYRSYPRNQIINTSKIDAIDIVASGMNEAETKIHDIQFSQPYYESQNCVIELRYESSDTWINKRIAVLKDDVHSQKQLIEQGIKPEQFISAGSYYLVLSALMKNEADSAVGNCVTLSYHANGDMLEKYPFSIQYIDDENKINKISFVVGKEKTEILDKINSGLSKLKQNGELQELIDKWIKSPRSE